MKQYTHGKIIYFPTRIYNSGGYVGYLVTNSTLPLILSFSVVVTNWLQVVTMINFNEIESNIDKIIMFAGVESSIDNMAIESKLNQLINNEFQKDFIKKLYPNPLWTNRVYWNVIGKIQNEHEDIKFDDIIKGVDQYLEDNNMCISQRDLLKFIHESIISHQIEGKSKKEDVSVHAAENGVTVDRFNEAIKRMKADGSIFEPEDGFYRCI